MNSTSFLLALVTCLLMLVSCMHQTHRINGWPRYRKIDHGYLQLMKPRHDLEDNSYSAADHSDDYGEHGLVNCKITTCCRAKIKGSVKECFFATPLLSGLLSLGLIRGFADPSLLCTTYSTVTTTVTTTTTDTVTDTITTTTTETATNTELFTSTLTATAMSTTTLTTTITAPAITNTIMIPVTDTTTTTVTTLLPRTDCNNTGRKKRRAFTKFVEESSNEMIPKEELEPGPQPAAKVSLPEVLPSFAY